MKNFRGRRSSLKNATSRHRQTESTARTENQVQKKPRAATRLLSREHMRGSIVSVILVASSDISFPFSLPMRLAYRGSQLTFSNGDDTTSQIARLVSPRRTASRDDTRARVLPSPYGQQSPPSSPSPSRAPILPRTSH